jgi:hypothetical protein
MFQSYNFQNYKKQLFEIITAKITDFFASVNDFNFLRGEKKYP